MPLLIVLFCLLRIFITLSNIFYVPYQRCLRYKNEEWAWLRKSLVSNFFLNCELLCAKTECAVAAASPFFNRAAEWSYFCCHQLGESPQKFFPLSNMWQMESSSCSIKRYNMLKNCNIVGEIATFHYASQKNQTLT